MSRRTITTRALLTALACACLWVGCGESPTTDPSPIDPETILREELARQGLSPSWFPGCIWQTFRLRLPSYQGQSLEFILADIRAIIAACLRTNQVVSCPAAVNEDIAALFPTENNLRQDAVAECGRIYQDFEDDEEDAAAEKAVQFFGRTLEQNENGELLDPAPSAEQKIAEIFAGIFDDVGLDFPDIDPGALASGEYAVGTLVPNGPPLLTSSKHAGIDDGGGLFGPVQVIIVQIHAESGGLGTSSVSHPCPAGIDDRFDCYPLFFDYTVVPASNVNPAVGLKLGQCNISPPEIEVLLATPEGLLPEDDSPVGLDCTDVQPQAAMTGWRSFAWSALEPIAPLFRVREAFAGKNPVGGRISAFSPVAPVRPSGGGGVEEPPPPGTDIVVFNDVNVFDDFAMSNPNNVRMVENLVGFTTGKARDDGDEVWFDCRTSLPGGGHGCTDGSALHNTIEAEGFSTVEVLSGSLDDIPAQVKVLFLWLPTSTYPTAEINAFKQFAEEGGGSSSSASTLRSTGRTSGPERFARGAGSGASELRRGLRCGLFAASAVFAAAASDHRRAHRHHGGCSSEIVLGPTDFALYLDTTGTYVLSGVATIDTTPLAAELAASRSVGPVLFPRPPTTPSGAGSQDPASVSAGYRKRFLPGRRGVVPPLSGGLPSFEALPRVRLFAWRDQRYHSPHDRRDPLPELSGRAGPGGPLLLVLRRPAPQILLCVRGHARCGGQVLRAVRHQGRAGLGAHRPRPSRARSARSPRTPRGPAGAGSPSGPAREVRDGQGRASG